MKHSSFPSDRGGTLLVSAPCCVHSWEDGEEALDGWSAGGQGLFLALLLCDAGQAIEVSYSSCSISSQCSASCPLPWALQPPSLSGEVEEGTLWCLDVLVSVQAGNKYHTQMKQLRRF